MIDKAPSCIALQVAEVCGDGQLVGAYDFSWPKADIAE